MHKRLAIVCLGVLSVLALGAGVVLAEAPQPGPFTQPDLESVCTVTIDCDGGGQVSCTSQSNSCSTQGDCVYCDSVRKGCCPDTQGCLDSCFDVYLACLRDCGPFVPGGTCHQDCYADRLLCEQWCIGS